jgi:hypothetical protein
MLGPSLGEGFPALHLGVSTTLCAENGHWRRGFCHSSNPSRLCLGDSAVLDSEGIRRIFRLRCATYAILADEYLVIYSPLQHIIHKYLHTETTQRRMAHENRYPDA